MIFYFSGTGNSLYFANKIAKALGEEPVSIAGEFDQNRFAYHLQKNEPVGFIFPVYAWAPPKMVLDFICRFSISGEHPYVFSLCTCGDEEGNATAVLRKELKKKKLTLDSAFTVQMPNNYIIGFDVDSKELESEKLQNAEKQLPEILDVLINRRPGVFSLKKGKFAKLKTAVVSPLFNRFALNPRKFTADDSCTRCGLCQSICPVHSITVHDKPVWGKKCTQCMACIHRCPAGAIQHGRGTVRKGRYRHPEL